MIQKITLEIDKYAIYMAGLMPGDAATETFCRFRNLGWDLLKVEDFGFVVNIEKYAHFKEVHKTVFTFEDNDIPVPEDITDGQLRFPTNDIIKNGQGQIRP